MKIWNFEPSNRAGEKEGEAKVTEKVENGRAR